jgi:hypothetical protein
MLTVTRCASYPCCCRAAAQNGAEYKGAVQLVGKNLQLNLLTIFLPERCCVERNDQLGLQLN